MTEVRRIGEQMKRAYEGGAWHGPAVLETLEGVTAAQAAARPLPAAHTIWELVLHMATWKDVVTRRLEGETGIEVPPAVDWPTVRDMSKAQWESALARLQATHDRLRRTLAKMKDADLARKPAAKTATRYILLHGIIQHDLYHAGQIAVLKKR